MSRGKVNHDDDDEALSSPVSRVYLCPEIEQIINCAMGLRHPIDVDALKKAFSDSVMIKHPRFCSLLVRDRAREYWRKTRVNIDDHFIIHNHQPPTTTTTTTRNECDVEDDVEAAVNAYLADLAVSNPLHQNKPLWEAHVLIGLNCIVLRVHHALGDGASLMSMLSACFGKRRDDDNDGGGEVIDQERENGGLMRQNHQGAQRKWKKGGVWGLVKSVWLTLVFSVKLLVRILGVKDETSVIYGGEGVELWPRKLETIKFELQDFKSIKKVIPNATVNDVLLGVVSSGLSKYLLSKSSNAMQHGLRVTAGLLINLRINLGLQELSEMMRGNSWWWGSCSWGNKTGLVLQPIQCCKGLHPLEHIKRMKAIMDQKKQSYEAQISYIVSQLIVSYLGLTVASKCTYRLTCNTTLMISNIVGPSEELAIADNPITYIRVNVSSLPQALAMHLVSYAGKADLQVMVAKDIISDSQFLAKCFQDSLHEMKSYVGC